MTPSIVFDFDGTLAVGPGPLDAYARLVAPAAKDGYLERVDAALEAYETGAAGYRDGYDVIRSIATTDGVDAATMSAAYLRSREQLGTELAPVAAMPELDDFLGDLRRHARLILATNAPEVGIDRVLERWSVRRHFDALHFSVGKPAGLAAVIRRALADGPVLAVGDIVEFDLAPAQALGADTALVGATAVTSPASVTMRGATLAELRADIEAWAASAASSTRAPQGAHVSIER